MSDPKALLRTQLRKEYASMEASEMNCTDERLIARVLQLPCYINSERVFLFASTGSEVNTHDLMNQAVLDGKTVLLPKCQSKGIMEFYEYDGNLKVGKFGISEPTGVQSIVPSAADVMIVPGLAFTPKGLRLGQGGGYYDRYLEKHPCITVGLCREQFLKKELPTEWNDLPVDYVITETAVYQCKNGAS